MSCTDGDTPCVLVIANDASLRASITSVLASRYVTDVNGTPPVAAVLDLDMPSALETLRELRTLRPTLPVVVVSSETRREHVFATLATGAAGYIVHARLAVELADAVDAVRAGGTPLSASIAAHVVSQLLDQSAPKQPHTPLTPAEQRVLEQLARGLTYEEIGETLDVSINTVRTRVRALYEKLGAVSRTEAVVTAARLGLIRIDA